MNWFCLFPAYPSKALVDKVTDIYRTRVSDVRFLIPVLSCLPKEDLVEALPKFLRLSPAVVKEV